ncbi:PocR ligand-binding domain-containing protein [Geothrix sp. 21YS21S-2]|uniref:PocR ligand-binding domain-containing protein n=1 Tax=Geothrix sp. 21YS21S-2 TaxID=3068893 RepID=UPI0027B97D7D|nr:PocR ligand-binding domain-containing protein [Geothrix sp. 21YS21S-2]
MPEAPRLQEILDLPRLQVLLDALFESAGIPSAIIGLEGQVLTASGWQEVCAKFHRLHPDAARDCLASDLGLAAGLTSAGKAQATCPRGLVDAAAPLVVEGRHLANVFTGQVLLEPPDPEAVKAQAAAFGFDGAAYGEAFARVPVLTRELIDRHLGFITRLAESMASQGMMQRRTQEARASLELSEERSRAILRTAMDGFWTADHGGRIRSVNDAYCAMSLYAREELLGQPIALVEAQEGPGEILDHIKAIRTGENNRFETVHRRKDGSLMPVELCVQALPDGDELFAFIRDIGPRRRAEAETLRLQNQLLQSQKMDSLGSMAGGIAHDMNNVLGAILGLASANLGAQPPGSPARLAFETIIKAAQRGGKMVRGLLDFARARPAEERELDLNELLHEEVALLERSTLSRVDLRLDLDPALRGIRGDPGALVHLLMNLCVNAVDAMGDAGTLTLRTRNADNDWVEVVVEDTGCGMSPEVLARATDPFFTTKDVGKGTGLGLAMVFRTVKAHRGQLDIQSEPGAGTQVRIRLPASAAAPGRPEPAAPRPAGDAAPMNVLVVDDDELIRCTMQVLLELLGTCPSTASTGEEALEALTLGPLPDVVILDMNMPGLGGSGTLPRLRERWPVPVLLATGHVDRAVLDLVDRFPAVVLLPKPYSLDDVKRGLEAARALAPGV